MTFTERSQLRNSASAAVASFFGVYSKDALSYYAITKSLVDMTKKIAHTKDNWNVLMAGFLDGLSIVEKSGINPVFMPAKWLTDIVNSNVPEYAYNLRAYALSWFLRPVFAEHFFDAFCTCERPVVAIIAAMVEAEINSKLDKQTRSPLAMMKTMESQLEEVHWARKLASWLGIH